MSLERLRKALTEPFGAEPEPVAKKNWLRRKAYAEAWGCSPKTIYRRTEYLRRIGAVTGTHKMTRYNPNIAPTGERKRT
jgi:hypothetical protein